MLVSVTLSVAAMTYTGKRNLGRKEFYFGSRFEVTAHHSEEVLAPGTWSKWSWISQEVLASGAGAVRCVTWVMGPTVRNQSVMTADAQLAFFFKFSPGFHHIRQCCLQLM